MQFRELPRRWKANLSGISALETTDTINLLGGEIITVSILISSISFPSRCRRVLAWNSSFLGYIKHRHIPSSSLIIENGNETRPREHIEWIVLPRDLEEKTPSSHPPLTFGCLVSSMFGLDLAESIRRFTFANAKRAHYQKTKLLRKEHSGGDGAGATSETQQFSWNAEA